MSRYWNSKISNIEPYIPGEQPQDKNYIKLNTNENPYGPSPRVIQKLNENVNDDLRLYPDPTCGELINTIAKYYNLTNDQIFIGNGSDEVLALSFMTFFEKGRKVLFPGITYSFYEVYANLFNIDYELVPLDEEFKIPIKGFCGENGGIVIPNPNAPTSLLLSINSLKQIVEKNQDSLVIIDEAYIDFGGESMVDYINEYDNLLVIQTFSKSRSLAGMRIGIALGNKDLIEGLNRVKNSFNSYTVNRLSLVAAKESLLDEEYFNKTVNQIIATREWVIKELKNLDFHVLESKTNFLFVSHNKVPAEFLYLKLKEKGILVRYFNKERIDNYLRITIGSDFDMKILIETLKEILCEF